MANLKAFRQYDEHDVINLFSPSGADTPIPLNKGTLVSVTGNGWQNGPCHTGTMVHVIPEKTTMSYWENGW